MDSFAYFFLQPRKLRETQLSSAGNALKVLVRLRVKFEVQMRNFSESSNVVAVSSFIIKNVQKAQRMGVSLPKKRNITSASIEMKCSNNTANNKLRKKKKRKNKSARAPKSIGCFTHFLRQTPKLMK